MVKRGRSWILVVGKERDNGGWQTFHRQGSSDSLPLFCHSHTPAFSSPSPDKVNRKKMNRMLLKTMIPYVSSHVQICQWYFDGWNCGKWGFVYILPQSNSRFEIGMIRPSLIFELLSSEDARDRIAGGARSDGSSIVPRPSS